MHLTEHPRAARNPIPRAMRSVPTRHPPAFILPECQGTDASEESYAWDGVTSEARIIQTRHGPLRAWCGSATASGAVCTAQLWRHVRATPFALAFQGGSTDGSMGRSRWVHSGRPLEPVRPSTCWRTVVTDRHAMLHVVCRTSYRGRYRRAGALS